MSFSASCEVRIPPVSGLEDGKLTVGRPLELVCKANEDHSGFDFAKAVLKQVPDNPYLVKLLSVKSDDHGGFTLNFVYYAAGEHAVQQLVMADGKNEIALNGGVISVASVLTPADPAKPQEPYGPILPMMISVPLLYYAVLIALVLLIGGIVWRRVRKVAYYRQLRNKIASYESPMPADSQFYRAVRLSEKNNYPMESIEKAFRLYVLRSYRLPMFDLTDAKIHKYFKYTLPAEKEARTSLQRLLSEFDEYRKRKETAADERAEFVKKLYRFVEQYKGITE